MRIIGICGLIASGKSTCLQILKQQGYLTFCADNTIALAYNHPFVQEKLSALLPTISENRPPINKSDISKAIAQNPKLLDKIENILHPIAEQELQNFIKTHRGKHNIALEIPLMFTGGYNKLCDYTLFITAPLEVCKTRALTRLDMTENKLNLLSARQNQEKRLGEQKADFIINSDCAINEFADRIHQVISTFDRNLNNSDNQE